ncbi:hypothetical protein AOA12_20180 [Microbacterium sp. No. 7]|nr:hypothetical protein AOA12_20180 [Microbacterium sp. No. 7]
MLLRKDGWTMREIADATGMNKSSLQRMLRQPGRWVTAETTQRILGVHSLQKRTTAFVDATGTRRRIQGLAAQGWTLTALGQRIGKDAQQMWSWTHANLVTVAIHELIKELYDELEVAPPPEGPYAVRARRMAVKHGWVPGLCWDDIDDPRERPKGLPKAA